MFALYPPVKLAGLVVENGNFCGHTLIKVGSDYLHVAELLGFPRRMNEAEERMSQIVKVRLTEYYPFQPGMTKRQRLMEGGTIDVKKHPLYALEDFLEGRAPYVSLARDYTGGPPGGRREFRTYGFRVRLLGLEQKFGLCGIDFRLVDTGGNFFGAKKEVRIAGREPIDVCRRHKPAASDSFSGLLTDLLLLGPS